MIKNIKQIHSGRYIVNVMNTLTPSGMLETNLTSQKVYNINVTVSTGSIARDTSITSGNSVIIGAGVGAVVIFISIAVIGGLIFISRKRQINRRNEDSNDRAYDSTPTGPGQSSNREMHVYNDLENVEGEANKLKKNIDESSYEEIGDVKRIRTDNIYQNMTLPDNESQKQYKEKIIYENLHP
ncbi:uncharacterized protein LOC134681870 [Mytilus trossulus]|uniref:uncharacterized protein LOC134681870 n=1 Tax=Mytilus trossulus TaxID=6551 RepID=UPI003004FD33